MRHDVAGVTIELTTGDITEQSDVEVVVNAANAELLPGGGVAGAIHRAAGPALADECADHAPISPGQCVLTAGHALPNRHVLHCLGPVYGIDEPADRLLADCYRNALLLADDHGLVSVAFPAISTGAFGYPLREAAEIALGTVVDTVPQLRSLTTVRLVLFDETALQAHQHALARVTSSG
ncbi:MAG: macro domain-containing protein [Egibacteraceae bacterium]